MLQKVILNKEILSYIKHELSLGGYLSQQLINLPLEEGTIYTYLPPIIKEQRGIDYAESLQLLTGEDIGREFNLIVNNVISDFLNQNPHRIALFETFWEVGDHINSQPQLQYIIIKSKIYTFIKGSDKGQLINDYIRYSQAYPTVISLINCEKVNWTITFQEKIDEANIQLLANNIEVLLIGAYDGEGYIIWQKNRFG